jgi:outer membrane protein OmpA-like peptidoglycan-associated protein
MANFYNLDAIVTYSHLLNIVGRRMTDDPSATITVTGCADPAEGTPDVAARRADAVKSYLTNTWGIAPGRINTNTRGLPEHPSRSSESDGLVENARVEITSSSPAILSPVESTDTMLITTPSGLRFKPSIDPTIPIAGYTLFIAQNGNLLKTFADGNPLPPGIDWRISESVPWIPKEAKEISYLVAVRDSSGIVVPSATTTVPVERITSAEKARSGGQDIRVDRYSLILFGFDEDNITPDHQGQVDEIKKRIQPNSTVKVIGYTDRTGDAAYNQSLSERRAKTVARALGQSDTVASGRGETLPLYDNNTPEGRFYSRTVEVLVETPRK